MKESADMLLIAGDLTDYGRPDEAQVLARELSALRIPVVAVLGNHDVESGKEAEVSQVLADAGVVVLDGGFGTRALAPWGEAIVKQFVREAVEEALKLEKALARLRTERLIVLLHYAPVQQTVDGEPLEIYPGFTREEWPRVTESRWDRQTYAYYALALSKRVPALEVNVDTQNAVVTLTGKVPSLEVRELAGEIAGDTSGVAEVRNLLTVDPAARPDGDRERLAVRVEELEQQTVIAETLQEHPEMEGSKIKVRVAGRAVSLDGTVASNEQKWRAEQIASSLAGARHVRNNLR